MIRLYGRTPGELVAVAEDCLGRGRKVSSFSFRVLSVQSSYCAGEEAELNMCELQGSTLP